MSDTLRKKFESLSDEELEQVVVHPEKFSTEDISFALEEIQYRSRLKKKNLNYRPGYQEMLKKLFFGGQSRFLTPYIILINILLYIITCVFSRNLMDADIYTLYQLGGNINFYTLNGESWRLFTSNFLHGGLIHLAFNMIALFQLGMLLEQFIGRKRFFTTYFLAGIGGSLASIYYNSSVSIGASGAVFGLFGLLFTLLITKKLNKDKEAQTRVLKSLIPVLLINLFIGFTIPQIDNAAHIGGFLIGGTCGLIFLPGIINPKYKITSIFSSLVFFLGLFYLVFGKIEIKHTPIAELFQFKREVFNQLLNDIDQLQQWTSKNGKTTNKDGSNVWKMNKDVSYQEVQQFKGLVSKIKQHYDSLPVDKKNNSIYLTELIKEHEDLASHIDYLFLPPASE